jgi:hypothetical protein
VLNRHDLIKLGLYTGTVGMLYLPGRSAHLLFAFGRKDECNAKST